MDQNIQLNLSKQTERLNRLSEESFSVLLRELFSQYISDCHLQDDKGKPQFSENELMERLSSIPSLNIESPSTFLESLYQFISFISRSIMKPKNVHQALIESGLEQTRVDLFVEQWKNQASKIVETLKSNSFNISANQLQDINWKLRILTENSDECKEKSPFIELGLDFNRPESNIVLNLDPEELLRFYNQLETIQTKIDQLHQQ